MSLAVTAVGLFLVANPIGNLPIYLSFTTGDRRGDLAIARSCALTVAITLLVSDWVGMGLLKAFGISVGAFQAAGGLILLLIGLSMLRSETSAIHHDPASVERDSDSALKGVVPLGIPLIAGPGTIAMLLAAPEVSTLAGRVALSMAILLISSLVFLIFAAGERISGFLSASTLQILTRIMGLLLASIAVQMLFAGLGKGFPGLAGGG
ncbi:MAG: MarC family protein [Synechococcaceae cyanobacterium]|nr:MarC family protein [Synechococcaceae cyanobacterium]